MEMLNLIDSIHEHVSRFPLEYIFSERMIPFLEKTQEKAFHNWHWNDGHVTASMLIVNQDFTKVLLIFHKKFQRWLQFGGHSDDSPNVLATAIREFHEESGIIEEPFIYRYSQSQVFPIFDIDIHDIPADAKGRPDHKHYDIRFLGIISDEAILNRQVDETDDMRWFNISEVHSYLAEEGLFRMIEKIKSIKND